MNAKNVLNKVIALLSKTEVHLATAKLADGTIVESPSFDVEQPLEVVTEDGKVAAPDGEHELVLEDEEGNEILIKVTTEGGVIVSRADMELEDEVEDEADAVEDMVAGLIDTLTPDEVSTEVAEEIAEKVLEALEDKIEILKAKKKHKMEAIIGSEKSDEKRVEELEDEDEDPLMKMAYRIEELEKRVAKMELPDMDEEVVDRDAEIEELEDEEEELPKFNGAPVDKMSKVNVGKAVKNSQSAFLSKLYK